jgi:protein disulfide-isomerase
MKRYAILLFLFLSLSAGHSFAQKKEEKEGLEWYTNLLQANELSKASHKPIFAFFTGSDWCGWCRKLQNEVFSKPAFVKWAKENVILLELDFPRAKKLPAELAQQNYSLQNAFHVAGYPTVWIFNMTKNDTAQSFYLAPLGSTGYPAGAVPGKEELTFIHNADSILANK